MYRELRRAAAGCLRQEWSTHTLQSTALVHEAYAALASGPPVRCQDRTHFLGIVRRLMRQILIQYARRRGAAKRGGNAVQVALDDACVTPPTLTSEEDALEEALARLRRLSPRRHLIVEMHYRGGCSVPEVAAAAGVSIRTVERELSLARAWLEREIRK
jgi:RNA polymerase sigma factor (TIGR02999 family)